MIKPCRAICSWLVREIYHGLERDDQSETTFRLPNGLTCIIKRPSWCRQTKSRHGIPPLRTDTYDEFWFNFEKEKLILVCNRCYSRKVANDLLNSRVSPETIRWWIFRNEIYLPEKSESKWFAKAVEMNVPVEVSATLT